MEKKTWEIMRWLSPEIFHVFIIGDVSATHREEMGSFKLAVDNAIERLELFCKIDKGEF